MRALRLLPLALVAIACSGARGPARTTEPGSFRTTGIGASADPTVRPSRLLPESVDEAQGFGAESGGGTRAITAGLRVVTTAQGAMLVAEDRLPQPPQLTTALPDRLGGGFLFVLGTTVWRADGWLGRATPIFTSPQSVQAIVPGLDRVYLRAGTAYVAIDGRSGRVLDLGPWPAGPSITGYAAADGWRAAAISDLRGVVATYDAGATWRTVDLPIEPKQVLSSGESLAIGGIEQGRAEAWYELRADGSMGKLAGPPREAKGKLFAPAPRPRAVVIRPGTPARVTPPAPPATVETPSEPPETPEPATEDAAMRIFGKRPLASAIEDGWPLTDGTAVVARDGALARVRLSDGALVEVAQDAYPMKPSRCHPVSLTRPNAVGAFGFVCGEPRGATGLYAYEPLRGRLAEIKRFARPRVVTSSGNGAIAVRGGCAEDADPSISQGSGAAVHPYCVLGHDNLWREVHVRGDVGDERVVVLADGRLAVISPPQSQSSPARLTLLDKGRATTVPVVFPKVAADVGRVLRLGVWLEGFEERRPGVIGGWIEAGGVMLGVEIELDGKATPGQYVRDAGMPFVAGRYGFGWTASRRGYETTDGGMTWSSVELPEPLVPLAKVERRACGPVGCIAGGWLRVGWGEGKKVSVPPSPPAYRPSGTLAAPRLQVTCEPVASAPPPTAAPKPRPKTPAPKPTPPPRRSPFGGPPVLAPTGGVNGVTEMPPFYAQPGPALRDAERGVPIEVQDLPERYPRLGPLARLYAWGPKTGDWDTQGKWQVKWLSPFAGWPEVRASAPTAPPQAILDFARVGSPFGYGFSYGGYGSGIWHVATGDDPAHAMLFARRMGQVLLYELEAERAPLEIRRADGEPFHEIDGVVRAAGRWFVATPPPAGISPPETTIWQIDGAVARELARVPRAGVEPGRATGTRLARRSDGRALGLVVDGQPTAERTTAVRWVLPIDLESGQLGEPEALGYADLAGRALEACSDDVVGWVLDASLPGATLRMKLPKGSGSVHSLLGRLRLTSTRACLDRVAGMYGAGGAAQDLLTKPGAGRAAAVARPGGIVVTAMAGATRHALRCTIDR